ncbi:hypothetical protein BUALT_BualtUnG0031100 [Buddleja alternifolia]|uniref:Reverse transcriptase domain-containing protein n=1 Tax=Buddleja alternifolia TaxID=168488 RepID=A0AAV6W541_9LAMI|nr:hypothetical protein BUALT_BualtUnG0031100 [Buddleja alternifolia]
MVTNILPPQPIQLHSLRSHTSTNSITSFAHIYILLPQSHTSETPHPKLAHLLAEFAPVFDTPTNLPPHHTHNHHIHLNSGTKPVNIRPYRYPQFQRTEVSHLISKMLRDGIIRVSHSPYSSPILLVKKWDGTWRFCADYQALNAITIKDRFPIPTVDELLDELKCATIFSKLDLRQGYFQIWVHPPDVHKTAFRTTDGHYEFVVMPFGLSNAPSTFKRS